MSRAKTGELIEMLNVNANHSPNFSSLTLTLILTLTIVLECTDNPNPNSNPSMSGCISIFKDIAFSISTQPETKTMTYTPVYVVGEAYMLMWTNHGSVGVLLTNKCRMSLNCPKLTTNVI